MNALREVIRPENQRVTIDLPAEFLDVEEVEVIILPVEKKSGTRSNLRGKYQNKINIPDDFNEPLADFEPYMK